MSWPQPAISGYNATPPSDDGAQTASNVVAWATILAKIGNLLRTLIETTIGTLPAYLVPTGAVMPFAGAAAPEGWLLCYGQPVSRSTYADLFAAIGTTYGAGDGSTTFNVPDLRGRAVFGKDDMGGAAASRITAGVSGINGASLGAAGGDERLHAHSHTGGAHAHDMAGHTHVGPNHAHSYDDSTVVSGTVALPATALTDNTGGVAVTSVGSSPLPLTINSTLVGRASGLAGTGQTGGPSPNATGSAGTVASSDSGAGIAQNIPPAMICNWIIKS